MASGSGSSFGRALVAALADAAGGRVGVQQRQVSHWHARLSALTKTSRGYEAAAKAGLSVTQPTLVKWLSDPDYPIRSGYVAQINKAYAILIGRWPAEVERQEFSITGQVTLGRDSRERGRNGHAPLIIDGSAASSNDWDAMRRAWEAGDVDPDDFEDEFLGIIEADLGEFSEPPEFDGNDYVVEIR